MTIDLKEIRQEQIEEAVNRGLIVATRYQEHGLIKAAWISLRGTIKVVAPKLLWANETKLLKFKIINSIFERKQP